MRSENVATNSIPSSTVPETLTARQPPNYPRLLQSSDQIPHDAKSLIVDFTISAGSKTPTKIKK
jgi:hypothetical protein